MAPIKGFNNLFSEQWHQRVATGTASEQAAMRGLHTMVAAAALGNGTNGFQAFTPDGDRYELGPISPGERAGAQIRFGRPDREPFVHDTSDLLTPAGQALFNESLAVGEEGRFNPRETLVESLGTETLLAHRTSAASRVELAERVQVALQESIENPGQVSEFTDGQSTGEQLSWRATEVGSTAVYRQERLEDLVTDQGQEMLLGRGSADVSVQEQGSTTAPEIGSELVPDDLVTEHFRRFQDAAHNEASAMAEVEELIVAAAFGQEVDWQNSSHIHGQGPDMTVSFQTGVNEVGETTFESLRVVDLVDESVAASLGISESAVEVSGPAEGPAAGEPSVEAEREQAPEVSVDPDPTRAFDPTVTGEPEAEPTAAEDQDTTVENTTALSAMPTEVEGAVDPGELFTPEFYEAKEDADTLGSEGATYQTAVHDMEYAVRTAASGHGLNLEESEPWTAEEEPEPFGVSHHDLRPEGAGVQMQYWHIDGADGWVDSQEMLTPKGQAILSAALDVGEGNTFCPELIARSAELETEGWGEQVPNKVEIPSADEIIQGPDLDLSEGRWSANSAEHAESPQHEDAVVANGAREME
ncbi:MAG: hypothetical protein ACTHYO_14390 [Micrococcaceae bacterium]